MAVHRLVERCPPLDPNSIYCNLLQCGHFSRTSVAAEYEGELVGFVSGYLVPSRPSTLFIWQVSVDERMRGSGIASRMLLSILARPANRGVTFIETTVTPGNEASRTLFTRLAEKLSTRLKSSVWLDRQIHFEGQHDTEELLRIGPFKTAGVG